MLRYTSEPKRIDPNEPPKLEIVEKEGKIYIKEGAAEFLVEPQATAPVPEKDVTKFEDASPGFLKRTRFGAQMDAVSGEEFQKNLPENAKQIFSGGLKIDKIFNSSPFDKLNLRPNDTIVGIHFWKSSSVKVLAFFTNYSFEKDTKIKVSILRGNKFYYVDVPIKATKKPADGGFETPGPMGIGGFTHLVYFTPKGDFNPRNPMSFLDEFREDLLKRGPITGYFRTKPENGKLLGSLCTADPKELEDFFKTTPRIEFVKTERLTKEMFEAFEKTGQQSLPPADGGYESPFGSFTHIVVFKPKGDFAPKDPGQMLEPTRKPMINAGVHCGYFRTKAVGGKLVGSFLTTDPDAFKKMIESTDLFEFLSSERLTKEKFESYEKTLQESLDGTEKK